MWMQRCWGYILCCWYYCAVHALLHVTIHFMWAWLDQISSLRDEICIHGWALGARAKWRLDWVYEMSYVTRVNSLRNISHNAANLKLGGDKSIFRPPATYLLYRYTKLQEQLESLTDGNHTRKFPQMAQAHYKFFRNIIYISVRF